jgi:hypothetical protein
MAVNALMEAVLTIYFKRMASVRGVVAYPMKRYRFAQGPSLADLTRVIRRERPRPSGVANPTFGSQVTLRDDCLTIETLWTTCGSAHIGRRPGP